MFCHCCRLALLCVYRTAMFVFRSAAFCATFNEVNKVSHNLKRALTVNTVQWNSLTVQQTETLTFWDNRTHFNFFSKQLTIGCVITAHSVLLNVTREVARKAKSS